MSMSKVAWEPGEEKNLEKARVEMNPPMRGKNPDKPQMRKIQPQV